METVASGADLTAKARIRSAALRLFARQGAGATSLRSIAREAEVTPGLVVHHYGSKAALQDAVEEYVITLFRDAVATVPLTGSRSSVARARDAAVADMLREHPDVEGHLRRVIVTPGPGEESLAGRLVDLIVEQTHLLRREAGSPARAGTVAEEASRVLLSLLGTMFLQPALERTWSAAGGTGPAPRLDIRLRPSQEGQAR